MRFTISAGSPRRLEDISFVLSVRMLTERTDYGMEIFLECGYQHSTNWKLLDNERGGSRKPEDNSLLLSLLSGHHGIKSTVLPCSSPEWTNPSKSAAK